MKSSSLLSGARAASRPWHLAAVWVFRLLLLFVLLTTLMAFGLMLADFSIRHPGAIRTLNQWMQTSRDILFLWRLALYAALSWGLWKIWHAPGITAESRRVVRRIALASGAFLLLCEYAAFTGGHS